MKPLHAAYSIRTRFLLILPFLIIAFSSPAFAQSASGADAAHTAKPVSGPGDRQRKSRSAMTVDWSKRITVNSLTEPSELAALADNAAVTLDVTDFDLGRLPGHVKAALYSAATTFSAPQIKTSGDIDARRATSFSVPQLQTSGHIYVDSAKSFVAPQLQTLEHIHAPNTSTH